MKSLRILALFVCLFSISAHSQILTTSPAFPTQTDQITIYYNTTTGNAALTGLTPVYAHTGCITNISTGPNDWQHVVGNWGVADPTVVMTPLGNNLHKIVITPQSFYSLGAGETISQLKFVFRNQSGSIVGRNADGSDISLDLYTAGFNAALQTPTAISSIVAAGSNNVVTGVSSQAADLNITVNGNSVITAAAATTISYTFNQSTPGEYEVIFNANSGTQIISDTCYFLILPAVNIAAAPAGVIDGINYINNNTVILQLFAPSKDYVFVVGDFNGWNLDLNYFMNKTPDNQRYWLEISGLQPNVEYGFQYHINAEGLRVADIYADKILDQWNDPWIPSSIYPNIKPYPYGLTTEPVSVLEINQAAFNWTDQSYIRPDASKLVVYELLVRDFAAANCYNTLIDTLDYLQNLGITAIELMPINEFEGNNSWGYNPSFYFAPDKAYGTEEALKTFVNEAHLRGIAVVADIALNHSFGQSPMVRMYFDPSAGTYGQPTANNPWFNPAPKHDFNVGYDFNHESVHTRSFCKRVLGYWLTDYHLDGYRFDLSKGFTQNYTLGNVAAWSAYDQSRVNILTDYYNHIQTTEPGAYVILEHLADNSEETALSNIGMMPWGKMTTQYEEASMGYSGDINWCSYQARGWSQPRLVAYAESHDEERVMYKNISFGNSNGSYNVQDLNTALKRMEATHALLLLVPGPKMIWQFGELGYDYTIEYCQDGTTNSNCKTDPKPVRWDYYQDANRLHLYKVTAALNKLKKDYQTFSTTSYTLDGSGKGKRLILDGSTMDAVVVGNFDVIGINMIPGFTHTGTWYDYFTGNPVEVTSTSTSFGFTAGEYHVYTDQPLPLPDLIACATFGQPCDDGNPNTSNDVYDETCTCAGTVGIAENNLNLIQVYPNPTAGNWTINIGQNLVQPKIQVYSAQGQLLYSTKQLHAVVPAENWAAGMYILQISSEEGNIQTIPLLKN
jgi:1,4-alpha-glucan branching enzyme